MFEFLNR